MADKKIVIAVVVVVVVIIAIAAAVVLMNNNNNNNSNADFYFYINYGDNNDKTGWYTSSGTNVDDALAAAVKDKGITITYSKYGYPNFDNGTWGVYNYLWKQCNSVTATESVSSPTYGAYGDFIKSNGWESFSGYGDAAKKLDQSKSNIYYFAKYDPSTYAIDDPVKSQLWATAENGPFVKNIDFEAEHEYCFYINFGDNNTKTGWYKATGTNVDDALAAAIKDKGITLNYSKYGYPNFDSGTWGVFTYTWFYEDATTATASTSSPNYGAYGDFIKSNGWDSFSGYGNDAKKLNQSTMCIFYFAMYDPSTYAIVDPTETTLWQTASGSPFAA